jgi:MFS family permease
MQEAIPTDRPSPAAPARRGGRAACPSALLVWAGLALLLAIQYGLFRQYAEREVTWCYPHFLDQSVYLPGSYACYEKALADGAWPGLLFALKQEVPNGLAFETEAGFLYLILGASRLSALTLNFLHFALLQVVLFATLRWYGSRWGPAFLGVGLLMAAGTPFYLYGGLFDFRFDFAAFCLYGVFLCAVLRSGVFASWRWSLVVAGAAAWLILTRYLTAVYFAGVFAGFLGLLVAALLYPDAGWRREVRRRLVGLFVAGAALAAVTLPVVWWKWPLIRVYYISPFGSGENAVRAVEFGAAGRSGRLAFYARSLLFDHVGAVALGLAAVALAVALVVALVRLRARRSGRPATSRPLLPGVAFAAACLLVPLAALTVFGSVNPVVADVMAVPLLLLALLPLAAASAGRTAARAAAALAAVAVAAGLASQFTHATRPLTPPGQRAQTAEVTRLYEEMGDYCCRNGCTTPRVAVATVGDSLSHSLLSPVYYERRGVLLTPKPMLGGGVTAIDEDTAAALVTHSDVVVMPTSEQGSECYPFVQCMRKYRPHLMAICRRDFLEAGRYSVPGGEVVLFVKPKVRLAGAEGGWITDEGTTLTADSNCLKSRPHVELRGRYFPVHLGRTPGVRAELRAPGRPPRPVRAAVTVTEDRYRLVLDLVPDEVPDGPDLRIDVRFDAFFVPAQRPEIFGATTDNRHLVLLAPDTVDLLPGP